MITLDTNLGISSSFYYLLNKLREKYGVSGSSVDKNAQTQDTNATSRTEQTNETNQVSELALKENLDYEQLIEDLRLHGVENRFALLLMMPVDELLQILQLLGKEELLNGLRFFTKEKLLSFVGELSKKDLLKMLFHMFTDKDQIIEHLPLKELHRFLSSDKIEKGHFMNIFEMLPRETLSVIAGYLTGRQCDKMARPDLLGQIGSFKKYQMVNGIKKLDEKTLRGFITTMTESFPDLYNEFSHTSLFNVSAGFARIDLIDGMGVLENEKIIGMLSELPDKLLALTASQIDTETFADLLLNDHKDLLANLVLG